MDFNSVIQSPYPTPCRSIHKYRLDKINKGFVFEAPRNINYINISHDQRFIWCSVPNDVEPFDVFQYTIYEFIDNFLIDEKFFQDYKCIDTYIDRHGNTKHLFIDKNLIMKS